MEGSSVSTLPGSSSVAEWKLFILSGVSRSVMCLGFCQLPDVCGNGPVQKRGPSNTKPHYMERRIQMYVFVSIL